MALSMPFRLRVPRRLYEDLVAQARAEWPNECCGLLAGHVRADGAGASVGQVVRRYPLVNAAASPVEFVSEGRSMFAAVRDLDKAGLEILAVYHSHPASDPVPSRTDRERNYSSRVVNLIVSLKTPEPVVRGWWLTAEDQREAEWEIMEDGEN